MNFQSMEGLKSDLGGGGFEPHGVWLNKQSLLVRQIS